MVLFPFRHNIHDWQWWQLFAPGFLCRDILCLLRLCCLWLTKTYMYMLLTLQNIISIVNISFFWHLVPQWRTTQYTGKGNPIRRVNEYPTMHYRNPRHIRLMITYNFDWVFLGIPVKNCIVRVLLTYPIAKRFYSIILLTFISMVMSHVDVFLNRSIVGAKLLQIYMLYLAQYYRCVFGYYRSVFYI